MRRSPLVPIFLIVLVDVLGLTIVIPLLAIYSEQFGASALVASLLMPTFAACQLVAGPILGRLSDRHGRRPILLISQLGTLIGFVMLAEATTLWMVFFGRALDGLTAGNLTVAQAYISDHTPPEKRARAFGLIGIAFGLGFLVGPAVTGWLSTYSIAAPFWAAAGLSGISIMGTWFLLPRENLHAAHHAAAAAAAAAGDGEAGPGGRRLGILDWGNYATYFARPVLRGLLIQFFVYMFAFSMFTGGFALFAERHLVWEGRFFTPREIGFTFAVAGLVGLIVNGGLLGRLVARFGEHRMAVAGFVALAAGYLVLGVTETLLLLAVSTLLSGFGAAVVRPSLTSLVSQLAARHEQGVILGLTQSLSSLAAITAPPIAGLLIDNDQGRAWAWLAGAVALCGALIAPLGSARAETAAGPPASARAEQ